MPVQLAAEVIDRDGRPCGHISRLIANQASRQVAAAVLRLADGREVVAPADSFSRDAKENLVINRKASEASSLPVFDPERYYPLHPVEWQEEWGAVQGEILTLYPPLDRNQRLRRRLVLASLGLLGLMAAGLVYPIFRYLVHPLTKGMPRIWVRLKRRSELPQDQPLFITYDVERVEGYMERTITNGVHPHTWASPPFRKLYDEHLPGWCHEPEQLVRVDCCIDDEAIWQAHCEAKATLIARIKALCGVNLDADLPILGFARRMTAYKRPDLLFQHISRLQEISRRWPFQIVLAGKAHPRDEPGKALIQRLHTHIRQLAGAIPIAFLPNYDMEIALKLISGADVWLNTPLRPYEASGTSGMKAAFNGVPNLSVLDGWWVEGCIEGITGWAVGDTAEAANGDDAESLYRKLDAVVLPLYHQNRRGWIAVMKGAISKNASIFNSHHMMRRYAADAYIR